MYEIWLVINIVWEIALEVWPLLAVATLMWLGLMTAALKRAQPAWRRAAPLALAVAAAVAALTFAFVPSLTRSSLAEMGYWVDWANLAAVALAFGVAALAYAWPLLALRRPSPA
jgi:hypothetical protein